MQSTVLQLSESVRKQEGKISGVAYDTAWVAQIKDKSKTPVFPECVKWLLRNQRPDGSWGSQILNYHDRVISTLSAIMALKEIGKSRYKDSIRRGEEYIWENLASLELDDYRLIGSELLFPSLMDHANSIGLDLPYHLKIYRGEYRSKLSKVDESLWYSPLATLSHSLESLGDDVNLERLPYVLLPNGSVTNSPAATAFYLKHIKDERALRYLRRILQLTNDGSVTTIYPTEIFEYSWSTYNLMLAGLYFERYSEICDFLMRNLGQSGVGWSTESLVTDADDTAVVCKILHQMGYPVNHEVLQSYDNGEYFLTFSFELDPSVSTNVHVLDFIKSYPAYPSRDEVIGRLTRFLRSQIKSKGYWIDKWHVSPYYTSSHAVIALCDIEPSLAEKAVSWMLDSQNENGMWGKNGGTLEETAYAVQALMYYHQKVDNIDISPLWEALPHLERGILIPSNLQTELWIGKVLYGCPVVTLSSVACAWFMLHCARRQMG